MKQREGRLMIRALVRLCAVLSLAAVLCGVWRGPTLHAGAANAPTYTLIDLGQPSTEGPIYISPNSGLVLDLGLSELYDIATGTVTDVSAPPTGFTPIQMNDDGEVVGNLLTGPDEGGAVWTPATDAFHLVSLSTSVHTLPGGLCFQVNPDTNCSYELQAAPIFSATGINDNGNVVGDVRSQFVDNTGAQFGDDLNSSGSTFAAEAPGGDDADFTGLIPSGLVFPFDQVNAGFSDQCDVNHNAIVETDTYTTAFSPFAESAFAINDSNQILGTPCQLPDQGGNGVPEVWTSGGSLSSSFPVDNGLFPMNQPQLFNNSGDYVVGDVPGNQNSETLVHANGITVPILDPGGFVSDSIGGLNNDDEVVGTGTGGAFLWSPDATDGVTLQSLLPDDEALTIRTGLGIDNDGDVVGTASDSGGHTHDYVAIPGPVPIIDSVSPGGGPLSGGNEVTITGTNFETSGLTFKGVEFDPPDGGTPLDGTNAVVVSDTEIRVDVPNGTVAAAGSESFVSSVLADFVDSDNQPDDSLPNAADDNDYVFGAPVIDSVAPGGGPLSGANSLTITGSGFANPALSFEGIEFDPTADTSNDDAA
ncbi:MAG TPA: IPT/TIG domain-containing protein, partial [Acidimicrobiales bacterium]|nr:IPT/TIG domain-containing protein [Acidimicrobiales bacterium]